ARRIVPFLQEGCERRTLESLEYLQRPLPGRPVRTLTGSFPAPGDHPGLDVFSVAPLLAPEEGLAYVGHTTLDVGLSRRMPHERRVDRKPAVGGVLVESALKDGVVAVRFSDRRAKIVE